MMKLATLKTAFTAAATPLILCAAFTTHLLAQTAPPPGASPTASAPAAPPATTLATSATASAPSDPEKLLDLALATIADQQKTLKNLTASGVLKREERQKDGTFATTHERDVTVIYCGAGGTPNCRIECRSAKTPWRNGDAPFGIEKYTLVYDGNIALRLNAPGPYGPPGHPISMCEITPGLPYEIEDTATATGWADSTLGWWQRDPTVMVKGLPMAPPTGKPFLALVREARGKPGFTTQITTDAGHDLLKVTFPFHDTTFATLESTGKPAPLPLTYSLRFWLDPQKGFALTRFERSYPTIDPRFPSTTHRAEVTAFYEPAKGLYFPKHVDIQQFWGPPAKAPEAPVADARSVVDVSYVKVNTAVPEDMFKPEKVDLPEGANIRDDTRGEMVVIRGTPEEHQKTLNAVIERVREQAGKPEGWELLGKEAPELVVGKWVHGSIHGLRDLRGKVVLLAIAGNVRLKTVRERYQAIEEKYREKGLVVVVVAWPATYPGDESPDSEEDTVKALEKTNLMVAYDAGPEQAPADKRDRPGTGATHLIYGLAACSRLGALVIVDRKGIVRSLAYQDDLEKPLEKVLADGAGK